MFIGEAQLDGNGNVIGDAQWVYVYNEPGTMTLTLSPIPEPATNALIILGALMVGSRGNPPPPRSGISWDFPTQSALGFLRHRGYPPRDA